jgi:diaminopropionate ammonia-lyase
MRVLLREAAEYAQRQDGAERPIDFHRRLPGYGITPLVEAPLLATKLGVARVVVKNETSRFGLPSFKILGASWASYVALCERLGPISDGPLTLAVLQSWAAPVHSITLVAATDGNHGRAVARVASWFGLRARIYVPRFVTESRRRAIEDEGAELVVIDGSYDAAVDAALSASSGKSGLLLISDTARAESDVIPRLVSDGYTTAFVEAEEQLTASGQDRIDAVGVQAGVGGLAAAATNWARTIRTASPVQVIVTEPENAACVFTALAAGEPKTVGADQDTAMAVLQCGTVSLTAFPILRAGVGCCLAIEDSAALAAVAELRSSGIETGPSGAAGLAGVLAGFTGSFANPIKHHLGLSSSSGLLFVATESPEAAGSHPQMPPLQARLALPEPMASQWRDLACNP